MACVDLASRKNVGGGGGTEELGGIYCTVIAVVQLLKYFLARIHNVHM